MKHLQDVNCSGFQIMTRARNIPFSNKDKDCLTPKGALGCATFFKSRSHLLDIKIQTLLNIIYTNIAYCVLLKQLRRIFLKWKKNTQKPHKSGKSKFISTHMSGIKQQTPRIL